MPGGDAYAPRPLPASASTRPVRPHPEFELAIDDLAHDGRGIGRRAGKAYFVNGALPGETVRARLRRGGKQFDEAELLAVLSASPERVVPPCPHFHGCSGCSLQHLAAPAQIHFKQKQLEQALLRIGQVQPERWLEPLQAAALGYRRKARLSVRHVDKKGRVLVGFREEHANFVADLSRCEVLDPRLGLQLTTIGDTLTLLSARAQIPQIEASLGENGWAMVLRHLVPLSAADRAHLLALAQTLGCTLLLQAGGPDKLELLYSAQAEALHYRLPDFDVCIEFRPLDFIQVNPGINQAMVRQALDLLAPAPGERVLDLYCGLGNFTLPIARRGAHVIGVEGDGGLTTRARANAAHNGLEGLVDYHVADLSLPQPQASWARASYDKILLDPPRAGAEAVFGYLPGSSVRRIVYVACHPGTLARDAGVLVRQHGFRLVAAGVMDMFPHTAHVESMALFERP